jgi:tRNA threonylcarbamoyladenosine biosynthesis protein TsaB
MYALALDTTTRGGSVALVDEHRILEERPGDARQSHAERLPGELTGLLDGRGLTLADIDLFAVASGPGSFTGLRIGIATVQGLALTTRRPVAAVSALEALAQSAADAAEGAFVGAWIDARRGDVFAALYRIATGMPYAPERIAVVEGATVGTPAATLGRWRTLAGDAGVIFVGDGAEVYEAAIAAARSDARVVKPTPLIAGAIGRMGLMRLARGEVIPPAAIRPLYVRRPDAEIAREQVSAAKRGMAR